MLEKIKEMIIGEECNYEVYGWLVLSVVQLHVRECEHAVLFSEEDKN